MKKTIFISLSILLFFGCTPKEESAQNSQEDTQQQTATPQADTTGLIGSLTIMNTADYHPDFIKALQGSPLGEVVLDGNKMIENGETYEFPTYPELGKTRNLTATVGTTTVNIMVKRINQTTIDYQIEFFEEGKPEATHQQKGQATISAGSMFMGSESDENELTGNSYMAAEYSSINTDDEECYTSIRIGKEDDNGQLLGRLIKNCNGQYDDIDLDYAMFTEPQ